MQTVTNARFVSPHIYSDARKTRLVGKVSFACEIGDTAGSQIQTVVASINGRTCGEQPQIAIERINKMRVDVNIIAAIRTETYIPTSAAAAAFYQAEMVFRNRTRAIIYIVAFGLCFIAPDNAICDFNSILKL